MPIATHAVPPRRWLAASVLVAVLLVPALAGAQSKEACLDAHGKGQDLREAGKLSEAREQFLRCAQSACPSLVQTDCARFGEELQRIVPSVTFVARDGRGNDLTEVTVYVDDAQVTGKLSGRSYDVDPGSRTVRFVYGDKTVEQKVIISQGEKGRTIAATFEEPATSTGSVAGAGVGAGGAAVGAATAPPSSGADSAAPAGRPVGPLLVSAAGVVVMAAGAVTIGVGLSDVPDDCSYSDKECVAPPGAPVFEEATSAAEKVNVGIIVSAIGGGAAIGGLIWYFAQDAGVEGANAAAKAGTVEKAAKQSARGATAPWRQGGAGRGQPLSKRLSPWFSRTGGGLNYKATF